MTFLPLITRELGLRARRSGNYWTRFGVGTVGLLACLPELLSPSLRAGGGTGGQTVFNTLVAVAFILCCAASFLTSEAISGERREGTLGLLLLTRVRTLDVILGKLA